MNAPGTQAAAVVRPSRLVAVVMGPLTKVLNPVMRKLAGRRHVMMAAQIRHVGRRSGRPYVTPAGPCSACSASGSTCSSTAPTAELSMARGRIRRQGDRPEQAGLA